MNTLNYGPVIIPEYGSLIVNKTSNGLGGEIYIHESDKGFFNTTGELISVHGKKGKGCKNVYVLNERNEYTFDFIECFSQLCRPITYPQRHAD